MIFEISLLFMSLRSGNPLLTFLLSYHVWGPGKFRPGKFRESGPSPVYM